MRAILHVASGRLAGRRAHVQPGKPLRVGSGARSDVVLSGDDQLAAVHFELAFDGTECVLHGKGKQGTELDGGRVSEARVGDGSVLVAGNTRFLVRLLPDDLRARLPSPPRWHRPPSAEVRAAREAALAALRAEDRLFAVLDAARDPRIKALVDACEDDVRSLFEGAGGDAMAAAAPYLVRFAEGSALLPLVVSEAWGDSWGVFLVGRRPFDEVRRRLRRSLMVTDEATGKRLYFRFYDPRVLRLFWPVATPRQRSEMVGTEIERFLFEGADGEVLRSA